jgi:hypothetical protein
MSQMTFAKNELLSPFTNLVKSIEISHSALLITLASEIIFEFT